MKRLFALVALPLSLAFSSLMAGAATEPSGDPSTNPPCADFLSGGGSYTTTSSGQQTLFFSYTMEDSTCTWLTYTLYVLDGNQQPFSPPIVVARSGDGTSSSETYAIPITQSNLQSCTSTTPSSVWVHATVTVGPHEFDRAPTIGNFQVIYGAGCPSGQNFG
jgi:hypothetical protein